MTNDIFINEKQAEKEKTAITDQENAEKQLRINYGLTFSTREGFEAAKDILRHCHFLEPSHVTGDAYQTAFREGERNVALYILAKLSPELISKLIGG